MNLLVTATFSSEMRSWTVQTNLLGESRVRDVAAVDGLGDFFVGERTRVYVATGKRDALVVPADLVYRRYGVSYVKLKDGTEVVVQPGLPVDGGIEILSGLNEGDAVVRP